ncbi:hypothetical protein ABT404_48815 [Streptomyces hyaluromycini]|uniref:Uncharacterized protein n=1 Tax=Streptomyces hyaluromycini TaxID=1377993 RepID=A0ABV1XE16_9ACTN
MSSHRIGFDRGAVTVPAGEPPLYGTEPPRTVGRARAASAGRGPARA